ncbi:hypothetical protein [Pseudomonas syringae group genomosp. 7]|nr:hypothetical protein [Pseudomonas syringae group genomosp. 7]UNB65898.1 hypothetical protein MME54_18355 [Pseudomonas syringae pv. helianthi]
MGKRQITWTNYRYHTDREACHFRRRADPIRERPAQRAGSPA